MNHYSNLITDYKQMMENKTKVIGVWDDHDYGANNADYRHKTKYMQRDIYLDFIGEPKDS